jgi:membrane protein DedA with SNARE-associated domain
MTEFVIEVVRQGGYLGIAFLMAIENIFPPIPSELIMGLGGILVARGHMSMGPLIAIGTLGTVIGNLWWFWLGRKLGIARLKPFIDRHGRWLTLEWEDVERVHRFFLKHGHWLVFAVRFTPTFRTMISLPAGMVRMPAWKFLVFTAAGSAIWNAILAYAGLILGTRFRELETYIGPIAIASIVLVVVVYLYRFVTWKPREHPDR